MLSMRLYLALSTALILSRTSASNLNAQSPVSSWHLGCYQLQSKEVALLDYFESSSEENVISGYYNNYNSSQPPPVYGTQHCSDSGFPFVAVLSLQRFYCVSNLQQLQEVQSDPSHCSESCVDGEQLLCGSSGLDYVSIYSSRNIPRIQTYTFYEPDHLFTYRQLELKLTINFNHLYGLALDNGTEDEVQLPVYCVYHMDNETISRVEAIEGKSGSNMGLVSCTTEYHLLAERDHNISIHITTPWETKFLSRIISVVHEVPATPDILIHLSEHELPTCISNEHELQLTEHKKAVKVYVDTPTPFKASVAQGINVTYHWNFDNETEEIFTTNYLSCHTQCYQSFATHTFTTLGVHEVRVNFSNRFDSVESTLYVIVVSRDIQNVSVTPSKQVLVLGERTDLEFSITTSTRYYTHVEIDQGDGSPLTQLSLLDRTISNVNMLLESNQLDGYIEVRSSYGVGCTLDYRHYMRYGDREGTFNLTWSVFNNNTLINSSQPIQYSVYRRISQLRFDGHVSYEVGMEASITAYFTSISYRHTAHWTLVNALTDQLVYNVTGERLDTFTHVMNETGTFTLKCEVWNPADERASGEVTLMVMEHLGTLTVSSSDDIIVTSTQQTLTFSAHLDSGLGAEFVWNVSTPHKTAVHKAPTTLGLTGKVNVTFIYPELYTVTVLARIGGSTTPVRFVRKVRVYENVTHVTCRVPQVNPSGCALTAHADTGSDVNMVFHFPTQTITQLVDTEGDVTVHPLQCPPVGVYQVKLVASNPMSSLEIQCTLLVQPKVASVSTRLTASYNIQLEATFTPQTGDELAKPTDAVYVWKYMSGTEEKERVSVLPFSTPSDLPSNSSVRASLQVYGLAGGVKVVPYDDYSHRRALIDHPEAVKPGETTSLYIKNLAMYDFTQFNISAFSDSCSLTATLSTNQLVCDAHPYDAGIYKVTVSTGADSLHSWIAVVKPLPPTMALVCPDRVAASRNTETLVSVNFNGTDYRQYYAYYTWYLDRQELTYTSLPHMLYELKLEREYSIRVVATNTWGSIEATCQLTAVRPLIELEVVPSPVHRLTEYKLLKTFEPTIITVLVYGPASLSSLTIDYGDGTQESFSSQQIPNLNWRYVDSSHNSITLEHNYHHDRQYKVEVSASTDDVTHTTTGIIYRSIDGIHHRIIGKPHYQVNYEEGDSAVLMTEVTSGDYIVFEWHSDSHLQVIETTANYSKARVTFDRLGRPNIVCKIINPAYPDGIDVDFGELALVVIKPEDLAMKALVRNKEVDSVQLEGDPINVTFRLKYLYGPNGTQVTLYDDGHKPRGQTVSQCSGLFFIICEAFIRHTFTKPGRYNMTMTVVVGNEVESVSTNLDVLPPTNVLKFINADDVIGGEIPVYFFPFGDIAELRVELQTSVPINNSVRYHCSFGDQSQKVIDSDAVLNVSHKYMSTKEAGFTVVVTANSSGLILSNVARVIIYKPIQRVEILAGGQGWTEENQGKLYFLPDQVKNGLLLLVKLYPENTPFRSCHIIMGEPKRPPAIVKTFLPDNSGHTMYDYDHTFTNFENRPASSQKLVVSAMCMETRPPGTFVAKVFANTLTVYRREPIIGIEYTVPSRQQYSIRVGQNLTFICKGAPNLAHFTQYLNGEVVVDGVGRYLMEFKPEREGLYNLTCVANNGISEKKYTEIIPILNYTCYISLKIISKRLEMNDLSWWYRSEAITLQSSFQRTVCQEKDFRLSWNITNMADGKIVPGLALPPVDDLFLPPRALNVGNYTATITVSIPGTVFEQSATLPFYVLKTPFKAIIRGGIGRTIDLLVPQRVELDGSDSSDPDCEGGCANHLDFLWACNVLKHPNKPCFAGREMNDLQFYKGKKAYVNTSEIVDDGRRHGVNIVLVVFRGNDSVITNQVWQQAAQGDDWKTVKLHTDATCETCTDGPDTLSSLSRPVVFKARCPPSLTDCKDVGYEWTLHNVPSSSAVERTIKRHCAATEARVVKPQPHEVLPLVVEEVMFTTSMTTTATTPASEFAGGIDFLQPTEEGTDDEGGGRQSHGFIQPEEEGGSGTDNQPPEPEEEVIGSTTTMSSIFDGIDFSNTRLVRGKSSRSPLTTTLPTTTIATNVVTLPGCACAIDGDTVISTYNRTTFEVDRVKQELIGNTIGGSNSQSLIIKPEILKPLGSYILRLELASGSDKGVGYYLLRTGDRPTSTKCGTSFSKRDANGTVEVFYDFTDDGEELLRSYDYQCYVEDDRHDQVYDPDLYAYAFEVYIERVPGELELVLFYRKVISGVTGPQRLPAGFPEYNYQVNLHMITVDVYGNREPACQQAHRVLPKNYTENSTATDTMYGLVDWSDEFDWYDEERTWGNVFAIRTNILAVSEVLNRVAETETSAEQVQKRMETRARLLAQLISTPHRYMAEVEQKLVVLKSIVKLKLELDDNSTMKAMDLLSDLVKVFIRYCPRDRPRNVTSSTDLVLAISSQLMRCVSRATSEALRNTYSDSSKLESAINSMLMVTLNSDYVPTARRILSVVNGMTIVSHKYTDLMDQVIHHGDVSFSLPSKLLHQLKRVKECYSAVMMEYPVNPFKDGVDSVVTSLVLLDCNGQQLSDVRTNDADANIKFALPSLTNDTEISRSEQMYSIYKEDLNIHSIGTSRSSGRFLNLVIKFEPVDGHTFPLVVLVRKDLAPTPHTYDRKLSAYSRDSQVQLFLDDSEIGSANHVYIGVADAKFNEGKPRMHQIRVRNYTISSWWSECVYWNTKNRDWSGQGCRVTKDTTLTATHCSCSHLTAFSSKREVIQLKTSRKNVNAFFKTGYYPTTLVMVSICVLTYIVLAIVSYMADRRSPVQERVIPIQDNHSSDRQRYIITLETGSEPGSGTTAKVSLVLHGEIGMSETRELLGPDDNQVFQTNSRDTFLLTLPASLGPIWKVQLWHDNRGSSPGWYVKRVTVRDIENGQSYYFLCERWLAVEEQDGKVEREFMALDSHIGFKVVFKVKAPQYFNDYHLIRSLVYKPTYSHFSRVERLTCVFVGLLAHMALCTAYYYSEVEEYRGQYNLFDLSSNTIIVSLVVNVMACPLMLALSMLFRRSSIGGRSTFKNRDKTHRLGSKTSGNGGTGQLPQPPLPGSNSLLEQSILHWQSLQQWAQKQWEKRYQKALLDGEELSTVEMQMQEQVLTMMDTQTMTSGGTQTDGTQTDGTQTDGTQTGVVFGSRVHQSKVGSESDVKQLITHSDTDSATVSSHGSSVHSFVVTRKWVLPPWFRFVAWFISFACASACGYCTIHYSFEFQEGRFVLWLQSIFVTFLFCNFLIQPFGILMKAVVTAVIFRKDPTVLQHFPDRYEEDIEEIRLRSTYLSDEDEMTRGTKARQRSRYLRFARPPQEKQLIAARKRTMKEKKLGRLVAECAILSLLLTLVLIIVFCCDRDKSYYLNANIKSLLSTNRITARHQPFVNISKPSHMWDWLRHDLADLLFTDHSLNLGASVIIGNASRIKQVRVQQKACAARDHMPSWAMRDACYPAYSTYTYDKRSMTVNNVTVPYTEVTSTAESVLYGRLTHYGGSGFDILMPVRHDQFISKLDELRSARWLDRQTRAVFVEFTVHNIPTNLYCSVTAFFEFSPSGQLLPHVEVDSAILYRYRSAGGYLVLTCELLFIFVYLCQLHFYIVTMMQERKKYFTQIWNILETLYLLLTIAYIVLYLFRFEIVEMLHNELTQTFHSSFVSVAPLVFWDSLLRLVLGLLLFILLVKILKLFRYVKTFARFGNVYRRAAKDIRAFAVFFLLLTIMYTNLGVALFQAVSLPFSDYWRGVMTVTGALTGSASFKDFQETMPVWGAVYMIAVTFTAGGTLIALMVSILSYHLRDFRQDPILAMDIKEAFSFLLNKFSRGSKSSRDNNDEDNDSQDLSPEFALAEMEYQVEELLFKMSALCDGVSLPQKSNIYYTTTDSDGTVGGVGDDVLSTGGSGSGGRHIGQDKVGDVGSLSRLLQLQSIGSEITDGQHTYTRSQLELDVLRQLQMSYPRGDAGISVWDDLRGVRVDRPFSDDLTSDTDIPIHPAEYNNPVFHSYQEGDSDGDDSFISIPDESHTPFNNYRPSPPPAPRAKKEKPKKHRQGKSANSKQSAQAEVYELAEHRRPPSTDIAYHNDAYVSDVEVEVDIEYTESPKTRIKGLSRTSSKSPVAYQNPAYQDDNCQQTVL